METAVSRPRPWPWLRFAVRVALGCVFIGAGVMKALASSAFSEDIENYQLLPHFASVLLSLYLPWLEVLCGVALLSRRLERGALLLTGAMLTVFMIALGSAWWRGLDIACGCFGAGEQGHYGVGMARDAVLLAAIAVLWKAPK